MTRFKTIREIRDSFRQGDRRAVEICEEALALIDAHNPALNAFNSIARDHALARAAAIDRDRAFWIDRPLAAVPVAVKDNLNVRGIRTTASSKILEHFVPPFTATSVERLEAAGAVVIGKTNCDEFAMGSSTENSAFGPTRNPWALDRIPGGSSGGSAAAVASGLVPLALGSDTGGSIRQPAAHCGIVGLKPTYGRVSRYGLIAFASSLDQIGPLTRTVKDAAIALSAIAGPDLRDATSARVPVADYAALLHDGARAMRIGTSPRLIDEGVDPEVASAFAAALDVLRRNGAQIVEIDLPYLAAAIPAYYLVATAEASSNLARYDGVRYGFRAPAEAGHDDLRTMYERSRARGFGTEVKRRIVLGTYVLSAGYYDAYYLKAQQVRTLIRRDYERAFERIDVVAMPTSPVPAFRLGERSSDPLQMYLADVFTVSANLAGLPAVRLPCGFTVGGLPIGLQLTGRLFDEHTLLAVAHSYERQTTWWEQEPAGLTDSASRGLGQLT